MHARLHAWQQQHCPDDAVAWEELLWALFIARSRGFGGPFPGMPWLPLRCSMLIREAGCLAAESSQAHAHSSALQHTPAQLCQLPTAPAHCGQQNGRPMLQLVKKISPATEADWAQVPTGSREAGWPRPWQPLP